MELQRIVLQSFVRREQDGLLQSEIAACSNETCLTKSSAKRKATLKSGVARGT